MRNLGVESSRPRTNVQPFALLLGVTIDPESLQKCAVSHDAIFGERGILTFRRFYRFTGVRRDQSRSFEIVCILGPRKIGAAISFFSLFPRTSCRAPTRFTGARIYRFASEKVLKHAVFTFKSQAVCGLTVARHSSSHKRGNLGGNAYSRRFRELDPEISSK